MGGMTTVGIFVFVLAIILNIISRRSIRDYLTAYIVAIGFIVLGLLVEYKPDLGKRKKPEPTPHIELPQKQKRVNQSEINKAYSQIKTKAKAKIKEHNYSIVKEIMVVCDGTTGKAEYAVKKSTYTFQNGEIKRGTESKVYEIAVRFKKYNDFEIIDVELFDRGNLTVRKLN